MDRKVTLTKRNIFWVDREVQLDRFLNVIFIKICTPSSSDIRKIKRNKSGRVTSQQNNFSGVFTPDATIQCIVRSLQVVLRLFLTRTSYIERTTKQQYW